MRLWKVALLLNLAIIVTGAWGWVQWGRHVERLRGEVAEARASAGGEREWRVAGVVRAILPEVGVVILSHEEITGFMPPMTMGFRTASPKITEGVSVGDAVRFTLRGAPPNVLVTAIDKTDSPSGRERK
jgi:Cu/Ag efflux protein CusF